MKLSRIIKVSTYPMSEIYNPRPIFQVIYVELVFAINNKDWDKVKETAEQIKIICNKA